MARKRLSRRELVEKDDITSSLESATSYVMEHGKSIGSAVGVVILVAAVIAGVRVVNANRQMAAEQALGEVIRVYGLVDETTTDEERFQSTLTEAARVQSEYPNQPAAQIARYYEALAYRGLGNFDEAIAILTELSDAGTETIHQIARFALAESYREEGQLDLAIQNFQALLDQGGYGEEAILYEMGRLHERLAMPDEARDYYQTLVGDYPDSPFRSNADRALRRLAPADSGDNS